MNESETKHLVKHKATGVMEMMQTYLLDKITEQYNEAVNEIIMMRMC